MVESGKENLITNYPAPLTRIFGRETEKALVTDLFLTRQARLLTLTGVGGVGKTRLSLEIAAGLSTHFKDGVWFIELAPLIEPALLPDTIAAALAIQQVQQKKDGKLL